MTDCTNCGADDWKPIHDESYTGEKGGRDRDPTEKEVFRCRNCGAFGRRYTDGPTGHVRATGAMRSA